MRGKLSSSELKCGNCSLGVSSTSIIESSPTDGKLVSPCFITSAGCSNMLRERRICFLGRCSGFDDLRIWPAAGGPIFFIWPLRPEIGRLNLGGPIGIEDGEWAECGRLSLWGDAAKHSSGDINEGDGREAPLPNLKGGHSTRVAFSESDVVVNPLVRDRDGLNKLGLRRLEEKVDQHRLRLCVSSRTMLTLEVWVVS